MIVPFSLAAIGLCVNAILALEGMIMIREGPSLTVAFCGFLTMMSGGFFAGWNLSAWLNQ